MQKSKPPYSKAISLTNENGFVLELYTSIQGLLESKWSGHNLILFTFFYDFVFIYILTLLSQFDKLNVIYLCSHQARRNFFEFFIIRSLAQSAA